MPATVEFVDIAGLVAGASQGEGLGNQFLANIRETDAIAEVVRFFGDPDVTHVAGKVDPPSDVDTIKTELILADIATVEKAIPRLEKEAKRDKAGIAKLETAKKVLAGLNEGHRARTLGLTEDEVAAIYELHLLTMKPMLYIANVDEDAVDAELPEIDGCTPVPISAKVEADIAELAEMDPDEAKEYMEALGLTDSGLARLIREAYHLLGLQSYFTSGETETRAWTIPVGAKAPRPPASSTATSSAASSRPRRPPSRTTWPWVARRAAATRGSCVKRARTTSSKTATSCTSSSTCNTSHSGKDAG